MVSSSLLAIAAENWAFRWRVEREAQLRFARMAERLAATGASQAVIDLAQRAVGDEQRHAVLCAEMAESLGGRVDPSEDVELREVAPEGLGPPLRLTYEVVAACCIAETESSGTLTCLLGSDPPPEPRVREVLHAIARDEIHHGRLGWAYLAQPARSEHPYAFLGPLIPGMLVHAEPFYRPSPGGDLESEELLRLGVLPFSQKRQVFSAMLRQVIVPGLEKFGVDAAPTLAWLSRQEAQR